MKVSIYMPTFNAEHFISVAIESVLKQTHSNVELCICNDGSTDNTLLILEEYKRKNPKKIKIISIDNSGIGAASNKALALCTGDIIAQLDSDDFLELNAIEEIVKIYKSNSKIDAVYTDYDLVSTEGKYLNEGFYFPIFNRKALIQRMIVHP